jgi:hypothetical protein
VSSCYFRLGQDRPGYDRLEHLRACFLRLVKVRPGYENLFQVN